MNGTFDSQIDSGEDRGTKSLYITGLHPGLQYIVDHYYIYAKGRRSGNMTERFETCKSYEIFVPYHELHLFIPQPFNIFYK